MPGYVPDATELMVINLILGTKVSTGIRVKLFKNNVDPATLAHGVLPVEANFAGYAAKGPAGIWDTIATDLNGKGRARSLPLEFQCTADLQNQTIYGYFLEVCYDGDWVYFGGERFTAPRLVNNNGDVVPVIVDLTVANDPLP